MSTEKSNLIPLSEVKEGKTVVLSGVDAGRGLKSRLAAMGLLPGSSLKVVNNGHPGPFVISVKGAKLVLGRGAAHKILVRS